jgi:hypothetical protein
MRVYINHGNTSHINEKDVSIINFQDLPNLEKSSCMELNISGILDYVPMEERDKLLETCVSKLRYGGTLHLSGLDLMEMARYLNGGLVDINSACKTIYGNKLSATSMGIMLDKIKKYGLDMSKAKYDNIFYAISCRRTLKND